MSERLAELDELIRKGWGNVPQHKIPADWRERYPNGRRRYPVFLPAWKIRRAEYLKGKSDASSLPEITV